MAKLDLNSDEKNKNPPSFKIDKDGGKPKKKKPKVWIINKL